MRPPYFGLPLCREPDWRCQLVGFALGLLREQEGAVHRLVILVLLAMAVTADVAVAHHVMDRNLPVTFMQGLLSGLGHPVIGLDHLAALIAVGWSCGCAAPRASVGPRLCDR